MTVRERIYRLTTSQMLVLVVVGLCATSDFGNRLLAEL